MSEEKPRRRLLGRRRAQVTPAERPAPVRRRGSVETEHSWLGPVLDERVARARSRMREPGSDADYDLVAENIDVLHYLLQSPGLMERPDGDVVEHFLNFGVELSRSPEPDFSMTEYLRRHPERAKGDTNPYVAWLREGRAAGELADPAPIDPMGEVLGISDAELGDRISAARSDLQQRLRHGTLGEMFAKAVEVEPLVGAAWPELVRPNIPPAVARYVVSQVSVVHRCQQQAGFRRARLVLVINRPRWGGGRRMEGHLAHALTGYLEASDIVVVYTDADGRTPPDRYPAGVREVDFASAAEGLTPEVAARALVELLRSFKADAIVNVNSRLFYETLRSYGKALAASERLFLLFFCNEQTMSGTWVGYPLRQFYRQFEVATGVLTDSAYLRDWFRAQYLPDDESAAKLHVLDAPVDPSLPLVETPTDRPVRPRVYWAGRWDRQKRIGLFLEIARSMPDVDFLMYGESVLNKTGAAQALPSNVLPQGPYAHISDLDLAHADAWLYTSGWDGVPSLLLEVGMTGVPIVATLVGGTGEVIGDADAWPVAEDAPAEAYEAALRQILADPAAARERAGALRERLLRERGVADFASYAAELLLVGEER